MLTFKNYKFGEANCTGCLISWIQATLNWKELQFKKKKASIRLPVGKLMWEDPAHWEHVTLGRCYWMLYENKLSKS